MHSFWDIVSAIIMIINYERRGKGPVMSELFDELNNALNEVVARLRIDLSDSGSLKSEVGEREIKTMNRYSFNALISANNVAESDLEYLRKAIDIFNMCYEDRLIYIYGTSGTGKTFLLNSFFKELVSANNNRVLFYRVPDFCDELVKAVRDGSSSRFMEKLCHADVLLFDDVDKLVGKTATQEEFERLINRFIESNNKLMLITGTYSPDALPLTERLRNRLSWGKVIELKNTQER